MFLRLLRPVRLAFLPRCLSKDLRILTGYGTIEINVHDDGLTMVHIAIDNDRYYPAKTPKVVTQDDRHITIRVCPEVK